MISFNSSATDQKPNMSLKGPHECNREQGLFLNSSRIFQKRTVSSESHEALLIEDTYKE